MILTHTMSLDQERKPTNSIQEGYGLIHSCF
uniref:Enhancer of polycomb-like protein n=1 Tax=Rhizophora mucronata TaxID=61149 RepID=A0A2P2KF51_RHIMU